MKQTIVICAGLLALDLASAGPASAQAVGPAANALPPFEIVKLVRATGLEPVSRPVRHGPNYALHAIDPAGQPVRVVVDARLGRIVAVAPDARPRFAAAAGPGAYGRPPAALAGVPDGSGPESRPTVLPPGFEVDGSAGTRGRLSLGPGRITPANPTEVAPTPAPLPRPRPKMAAAEATPVSVPATTAPATLAKNTNKDVAPPASPAAPAAAPVPAAPAVEMHE